MKLLLTNIRELLQVRDLPPAYVKGKDMQDLPSLKEAWLLIKDGIIEDFGTMGQVPTDTYAEIIDCSERYVLPTWCDSHTHLVYAGNREQEFVDRIHGLSYQEIAEKGGGILNSAKKLQETPEDELFRQSEIRLKEVMAMGTGAIEIKSGYGLTLDAELKMLRVAKQLEAKYPIEIRRTFLGAHAVPNRFKGNKEAYLDEICTQMLPAVHEAQLATYVDIFCEDGYFSVADTERLLTEAKKYGLLPKIHVNQFTTLGGVAAGVRHNAVSVDHLELVSQEDLNALKDSNTMPVALPACSFFLSIPYTPGREIIDAGLPLALATDFNPGSSPTGNMNFVVSAACIKMRLTPEEAINAATLNGAYAMGLTETHGSITRGKTGSVIITDTIPSYGFLPYSFGSNSIHQVIINGQKI